jgi:hypothetical protein
LATFFFLFIITGPFVSILFSKLLDASGDLGGLALIPLAALNLLIKYCCAEPPGVIVADELPDCRLGVVLSEYFEASSTWVSSKE